MGLLVGEVGVGREEGIQAYKCSMSEILLETGLRVLRTRKPEAQVDTCGGATLPAAFAGEEACSQDMCQAVSVFLVHASLKQPPTPTPLRGDRWPLRSTWGFNAAQAKVMGSAFSWETSPVPFDVYHL